MSDKNSGPSKKDAMALKKHKSDARNVEPGMEVEATKGDLGEEDISKPQVTGVAQDEQGNIEKLIVKKGAIFKKKLEIPADRVESVEEGGSSQGKVMVDVGQKETQSLKSTGKEEELPSEAEELGLLDETERVVPTHEGLRELEAKNTSAEEQQSALVSSDGQEQEDQAQPVSKRKQLLRILGPGFLSGMAGNDSSAVTAYAVDGATSGYSQLWLMLLSTPLYQAIQYACAKIGRITQQGFATILREQYGRWLAALATVALIITNVALIAADLV